MTCLATPCPIPERTTAVGAKPSVLLVEDDRLTRIVLRDFLKQLGYAVDVAENGEVAMAKLDRARRQGHSSSLILTDVVMPKMTGDRLLELLQQSDHRHIPVAVMSASAEATLAERLLTLGAAEFFVKPMSKRKLATLRRHIRAASSTLSAAPAAPPVPSAALKPPTPALAPRRASAESSQARHASCGSPTATPHTAVRDESPSHSSADHAGHVGKPLAASTGLSAGAGASVCASPALAPQSSGTLPVGLPPMDSNAGCNALCAAAAMLSAAEEEEKQQKQQLVQPPQWQWQRPQQATGKHAQASAAPAAPPACFPCGAPSVSKDARRAALARFRAKKAKRLLAPKVRYAARKKLAEARPRYRGQFIKADALPPGATWDPPAGGGAR